MLKLINRILKLSGQYKKRIQIAFVFAFFKAMLSKMPIGLAFVMLSKFYTNTLEASDCLMIGVMGVVFVLLEAIMQYGSDRLQSAAGYMMFAEKRLILGEHLRRLPMGYFTSGNIGKISSVLSSDMIFIEEIAMSTIANMMSYLFTAIIMTVFVCTCDIRLGICFAITSLLVVYMGGKMKKLMLIESDAKQEQNEKLTDAVLSYVEGISIIKSYNLLGEKSKELTTNFIKTKDKALEFEVGVEKWNYVLNILYAVGMTAILGLSIYLQQIGELSVPYLLGMLLFVFELYGPLKALYGQASRLTVMNSCLDRIETLFDEIELKDNGTLHIPYEINEKAEIAFEDVTFAYDKQDVIKNVSFEVQKNTMVALVGPSGGGKSTIANLLARFWDIKVGSIKIRGKDIRDIPLSELMNYISMVFQRVYLFKDTIYENISMGKPNATREEVYAAAKKARCYDFIMALPNGFDTVIGEGGATLSGGEKQRISIARCILKDAPIIILDEATASVDTDNERYIQEAITELIKGKTLIVIAHRLNTIYAADQIIVIAEGRIKEKGRHQQLMQEKGLYYDYVYIREKINGWEIA
ncbi:MAG: ABC transporter ATP-binding protein [Cellulosilyticum sp.]|nr:ABC transporter ATP-binding protein [Cellulosilyticum sp.]